MQSNYIVAHARAAKFSYPSTNYSDTANDIVAMINNATPVADKKNGPIIHFGEFPDKAPKRLKDECAAVTAYCFDYDQRGGDNVTRTEAEAACRAAGINAIFWNSFSANGDDKTFRMVLPLSVSGPTDVYRGACLAACAAIDLTPPQTILQVAQGFFFSPNAATGSKPDAIVINGDRFIDSMVEAWELTPDEQDPTYTGTQAAGDERLTDEQFDHARQVIAKLREDGHHLSNGSSVWHRVAQALCRYAEGTKLFLDFSAGDKNFSERECLRKLAQKRRGHATGIAHLFQIGAELGIENPGTHARSSAADDFAEELAPEVKVLSLEAIEYTLDGFLSAGVTYIAGGHGIGKSSMLVPLACMVSGEVAGLGATLTRKVIYITEDPQQARRVRYGLKKHNGLVENGNFVVLQAKRRTAAEIEVAVQVAVEKHTIAGPAGYPVKPLLVFDTTNACFEIENENDAAEVGRIMSALKQHGAPVWIVGHLAKAIARDDIAAMTGRGSGAWEADAQCTAFIFAEDEDTDVRYMATKKRRFEPSYIEVKYITMTDHEFVVAPWGEEQKIGFRYGIPERAHPGNRREEAANRQLENDCQVVMNFLGTVGEVLSKERVVTDCDVPRNRARIAITRLVERGLVSNTAEYRVGNNAVRNDGIALIHADI